MFLLEGQILPKWQSSWGQHGAHLGPVGPMLAPWTMLSGRLFRRVNTMAVVVLVILGIRTTTARARTSTAMVLSELACNILVTTPEQITHWGLNKVADNLQTRYICTILNDYIYCIKFGISPKYVSNGSIDMCLILTMIDCMHQGSVYAPSQSEMSLHCNNASDWLGAYLDWSQIYPCHLPHL